MVAAKAETTAQVTTNSAALTVPTTKRGAAPAPMRLEVTTGKAAGGAEGCDELAGNGLVGGEHEAAPDDDKPHDAEIAEDEGADGTRGHIDQYHGADDAADGPGNRQDDENAAVDIAMQDV